MTKYEDSFILKDAVSKSLAKINKSLANFNDKLSNNEAKLADFQKRTDSIKKLGEGIKSFGQSCMVGITLPVIAAGGAMVKLASDMQETMNKVEVSFGGSTKTVLKWSKTSIKTMGLAQQSALDSAALYGDMATGMGFAQDKAADLAMSLTQLGADLASFKNISNDMAQTALKSVFTGETESLKNLGVVMTEANLQQYGLANGMLKMVKANKKGSKARVQRISELSQLEQVMLRYNYVMAMTKNAQGDFERTGGGAANQTRMFQENIKELGVTFGTYLLPYFTKGVIYLNKLLVQFGQLSPETKRNILILGGLAAVVGPLITVLGTLATSVSAINTALMLLSANPIVLTAIAWTAAIAGIVAAVWSLIKAIQILIGSLQHLKRMKIPSLRTDNLSQEDYQKLAGLQAGMGEKAFSEKYGQNISKQVSNYRTSNINNTTSNSTTNNNFYGNINSSGSFALDKIIKSGQNIPAYP